MKLKVALKRFRFLTPLGLPENKFLKLANHLVSITKGSEEILLTPLAIANDPMSLFVEWQDIFEANQHKVNSVLLEIERSQRLNFSPRSIAVPWSERKDGISASWSNQNDNHIPKFKYEPGPANLVAVSVGEVKRKIKLKSTASLPWLAKKEDCIDDLVAHFDDHLAKKQPSLLYARTSERKKTRAVWGFPFADQFYEMFFYLKLLPYQKTKPYRSSLVSPDAVAEHITDIIKKAMKEEFILYSVDFKGFDTSVKYQYIILAFEYIKSCFYPQFHEMLDYICERFYTIGLVTPDSIRSGKHGVPSGSTFTNEVDSIVQLGIANTLDFINEQWCEIQGDDGVYLMEHENVPYFENAFRYAGLKLEKTKSVIASNYVVFCQNLFHIDYIKDDVIPGIYPTWRALNRLCHNEKFISLDPSKLSTGDYFGIRSLTILENCKHHPLFPELVEFIYTKEKFKLEFSDSSVSAYCERLSLNEDTTDSLNHQHGSSVKGIRNFESYKIVQRLRAEEEL